MVSGGDLFACVKVAALLTRNRQSFDVRSGDDIGFDDLRQFPTVLIGAFNNKWAMLLNDDLPFIWVLDRGPMIEERSGAKRQWKAVYSSTGDLQVDYAIVTRLIASKTGQPVIAIAGISESGTRAAAEFVTSPEQMKRLLSSAPRGWKNKNMQFVLLTSVVSRIPTIPTVVATRYW